MAQTSYATSVQGVSVRASRLTPTGTITTGATGAYSTTAFMRVSFTPEYEAGDEFVEKAASGELCVSFKANDALKFVTLELEICQPDPELTELLAGGTIISASGDNIGWASPAVGVDSNPSGSGLEVWSKAIVSGAQAATRPYFRWVFPKVQLRVTGERVIENGRLATVFSGFGVGNANFGDGPANDITAPVSTPYVYYRDTAAPSTTGYFTVV